MELMENNGSDEDRAAASSSQTSTTTSTTSGRGEEEHGMRSMIPSTQLDPRKIFIGGLPLQFSSNDLKRFFEQYGTVLDYVVLTRKDTGISRGFGFVVFESADVAKKLVIESKIEGDDRPYVTEKGKPLGRIIIKGKTCEIKAAEPKNVETATATFRPNHGSSTGRMPPFPPQSATLPRLLPAPNSGSYPCPYEYGPQLTHYMLHNNQNDSVNGQNMGFSGWNATRPANPYTSQNPYYYNPRTYQPTYYCEQNAPHGPYYDISPAPQQMPPQPQHPPTQSGTIGQWMRTRHNANSHGYGYWQWVPEE